MTKFPPTAEQQKAIELYLTGENLAIEAGAGCLAGDTIINVNRAGKGKQFRIADIVHQLTGDPVMTRTLHGKTVMQGARRWDPQIPTRIARAEGDVIRLGNLARAWFSGVKQTYTLTTDSGRSIRATADHPFLRRDGQWTRLGGLHIGDGVRVNTGRSARGRALKRPYRYVVTRFHPYQVRDSNTREKTKIPLHRAVAEADLNGLPLDEFLRILRSDQAMAARLTFIPPERHVHHKDNDPLNNALSNLAVLDAEEHHRLHAMNGGAHHVLWRVGTDYVTSIEPYGLEETYDIEVEDDPHNFLANGFVVHNSGKTATLILLAESTPSKRIQYVAFNRPIVEEAKTRFPRNVACNTAHSLAYRTVVAGTPFAARLKSARMKSTEIADRLGIDPLVLTLQDGTSKRLSAGRLASLTMRMIDGFCQSADTAIGPQHLPYVNGIDIPPGADDNNLLVAEYLAPFAQKAWQDITNPKGSLRFTHAHYLKMWHLRGPKISADVILYDEAQDANPVLLACVEAQTHAQRVYVGDGSQAIYAFTGAVNALERIKETGANVAYLTKSFRFGQAVADTANAILALLPTDLHLSGFDQIASTVGAVDAPDAILCRTNATAVVTVLNAMRDGKRPHLVGDGKEIVEFAEGAKSLMDSGWTSHPELACFDSWHEVQEYVEYDDQGGDLRLQVDLVDEFGADQILATLKRPIRAENADLVVSTAHKSKGREWDSVKLAGDFGDEPDEGELRLLYVAVTRARLALDFTQVGFLAGIDGFDAPGAPETAQEPVEATTAAATNGHTASATILEVLEGISGDSRIVCASADRIRDEIIAALNERGLLTGAAL